MLFTLDPRPFQIAVDNAKADLAQSVLDVQSHRSRLSQHASRRSPRRQAQVASHSSPTTAIGAGAPERDRAAQVDQARGTCRRRRRRSCRCSRMHRPQLAKLNGNPNLPPEQSPAYQKAKAARRRGPAPARSCRGARAFRRRSSTEVDLLQPGTLVISAMSAFTTTSAVGSGFHQQYLGPRQHEGNRPDPCAQSAIRSTSPSTPIPAAPGTAMSTR